MDATIAEGMARAKEKDERSLGLFNQLLERRGPNVRIWLCQNAFIHVDPAIVQETSTLPNANARIRMGHTDRRVHTKAQVREGLSFLLIRCLIHDKVTCSHTAVAPTGTPQAPPTSALTHVSFLTLVKVEEGQCSSIDYRYTPSPPHTLIQRASLASISRKRPTAGSCSTAITTPVPPAPGASGSLEARTHRSSSSTVTPAIQQSSFEFAGPRGIQPLAPIVQERPENVSLPPSGIPPHLLVPPSSHSPPQSTHTDPPQNAIDVAPTVSSERQKGSTPCSSNSLPRSEEKKVSPIHGQTKIKRSNRASVTQKPSTKFAPFSLTPSQPGPPVTRREAPSRLMMPGAFPGTSLDGVDMSSWVLVSPVSPDCQVEVSKRSWFKRMFSRLG
jgi:hypothetical protein